jgi:hypothetical protein
MCKGNQAGRLTKIGLGKRLGDWGKFEKLEDWEKIERLKIIEL